MTSERRASGVVWNFARLPSLPPSPPRPLFAQARLVIGKSDDPLEREADSVAEHVMRAPSSAPPVISSAVPQVNRACAACEEEEMQRRTSSPDAMGGSVAPPMVQQVLAEPGRPLDTASRAFFEPRFGWDFGRVRVHDGSRAAQSARAVGAHAYTVGANIVFANAVDAASDAGRRLMAHELAHTVQQGSATSAARLQRQVLTATDLDAMKDPTCPPDAPYRWGPKPGPGGADPAVVAPCMPTPMPRSRTNLLDPGNSPEQPAPESPAPSAGAPASPATTDKLPAQPAQPPATTATPAGTGTLPTGDATPVEFDDDPLSAAGFGPNDSTIRVRPGPVRTTLIRPRGPDLSCSYDSRQIAAYSGPPSAADVSELAKLVRQAFTDCDIAEISVYAVPNPKEEDPNPGAIARADAIKQQLMQATGTSEDRFYTGLSSGGTDEPAISVWLGGRNRAGYSSGGGSGTGPGAPATPGKAPAREEGEQGTVQVGIGDVSHHYTTPAGPNDALHEWLLQVVTAYTRQKHGKNKSGEEQQIFMQVQYSLTTHQWTVGFGGQESYVIALSPTMQVSFWAQLMAGENINARSQQQSLSAGTQFAWQPSDWASFGAQVGIGPTRQSSGPNSIDRSALIFFQIQK